MPTYEYKCKACGMFEYTQRISEEALESCPECGAEVERLISAGTGFILRGHGWGNPYTGYDD
jgi:putative FmdB family regulatory protein